LIEPDGTIELSSVGWAKKDVEELNSRLVEAKAPTQKNPPPLLFRAGEDVRDFRAG
jgi:hypothetical protein